MSVGFTFAIQRFVENRAFEKKKTDSIAAAKDYLRMFQIPRYESFEYTYWAAFEPRGIKQPERVNFYLPVPGPRKEANFGSLWHPPNFGNVSLPKDIEPIAKFPSPLLEQDVWHIAETVAKNFLRNDAQLRVIFDGIEIDGKTNSEIIANQVYFEVKEHNGTIRGWLIDCDTGKPIRILTRKMKRI